MFSVEKKLVKSLFLLIPSTLNWKSICAARKLFQSRGAKGLWYSIYSPIKEIYGKNRSLDGKKSEEVTAWFAAGCPVLRDERRPSLQLNFLKWPDFKLNVVVKTSSSQCELYLSVALPRGWGLGPSSSLVSSVVRSVTQDTPWGWTLRVELNKEIMTPYKNFCKAYRVIVLYAGSFCLSIY